MSSDILWYNEATHELQIWLMTKNKIMHRPMVVNEDGQKMAVGLPWKVVGVGDFDANGDDDILWYNEATHELQIWLMTKNKIMHRPMVVNEDGQKMAVGLPWKVVGVGAFNADGHADILWYNEATHELQIWLTNGNKITHRPMVVNEDGQKMAVGLPWKVVGVGAFNADGHADILWYNEATHELQIWLMNGNKITHRPMVVNEDGQKMAVGLPWTVVGVGDFDADGHADVLWYNEATHELQIWLMNGNKITHRPMVVGEDGQKMAVGLPWTVTGAGAFNFRSDAEEKMREFYLNSGAHRGLLGFPLTDIQYQANKAEKRFAGGTIQFLSTSPDPRIIHKTGVRVRFVGFHCINESEWDQGSNSDEPYFIISVMGTNRSNTVRFGPYEDIEDNSDRSEAALIADPIDSVTIVPPITLAVSAYENDWGSPEEAEAKVRDAIKKVEEKFDQVVAFFGAMTGPGGYFISEATRAIFDIVGDLGAEGVTELFGLGDDHVGSVSRVLFDLNPGLGPWQAAPIRGYHLGNPYNETIEVGSAKEGTYELRFMVEIADIYIHFDGQGNG
ncbi:MAG: VCBS repeat-containing protein [Anaerolineaceae bacterium]|nr:VCBS repeat-containing protein [Anaerolineaceae bacterium]